MSRETKPYYSDGDTVFTSPVTTTLPDGTKATSLGGPVCRSHEAYGDQAEKIAGLMNRGELADELYEALDDLRKAEIACMATPKDFWAIEQLGTARRQADAALAKARSTQGDGT